MTPYIYAIEKGLSASMPMNWSLSSLDNVTLLANSDAHSLENLGREANVFDLENPSYSEIYEIIKTHNKKKFVYSINFFPEEGKYHLDGHASCNIRMMPEETRKNKGVCPVCKKNLTLGVCYRVSQLADRKLGESPRDVVPFKSIVPLLKVIAESLGKGVSSKAVTSEYQNIISKIHEFKVLLDLGEEELLKITKPKIAEGIMKVRRGDIVIEGGYDGVFGTVKIWGEGDKVGGQMRML